MKDVLKYNINPSIFYKYVQSNVLSWKVKGHPIFLFACPPVLKVRGHVAATEHPPCSWARPLAQGHFSTTYVCQPRGLTLHPPVEGQTLSAHQTTTQIQHSNL